MGFSKETVEILNRPMEFHDRQGPKNMVYKYIKTEDVIDRLNEAFNHEWSSEIVKVDRIDDYVLVLVRLTVGCIQKEAFGGANVIRSRSDNNVIDIGNAYKSAVSNALKGTAKQFGIGLNEEDESASHDKGPLRAIRTDTTSQEAVKTRPYTEKSKPVQHAPASASAATVVRVASPATSTAASEMLEKAKMLLAKKNAETASIEQPVPVSNNTSPSTVVENKDAGVFPVPNGGDSKLSDLQKNALIKILTKLESTEQHVLNEAYTTKVIQSAYTSFDDVSRHDAAALIRHLTTKKQ